MMATFEAGDGNKIDKLPSNVVRLGSEGGYDEVARDLIAELEMMIAQGQTAHITDEDVETRKQLFLQDKAGRAAKLETVLEASMRSEKNTFIYRSTVVYYLAAARAYQEIPAEEKRDANKVIDQSS